jgi:hypothetical protein
LFKYYISRFIGANQITLNNRTGIKLCEENLEGKYSNIAESIAHAVKEKSCKVVAGICVNVVDYGNVKKFLLTDSSGKPNII